MLSTSAGTNSKRDWVCEMPSAFHTDEILPLLQNFCIDGKRPYRLNTSEPRAPCLQLTLSERDIGGSIESGSSSGEDMETELGDNVVVSRTSVPSKRRFPSSHSLADKIGLVDPMYVRL